MHNSAHPDSLAPIDFIHTLRRSKRTILFTIGACCVLALVAYRFIPKRYKITSTIALHTKYFQLPLVSGFLPDTFDASELRAQREALIRRALDHEFLADLSLRYDLMDGPKKDRNDTYQLEQVRKRFEIIPNGASGFIINVIAKSPHQGYQVMQEFTARLRALMAEERRANLVNLHDAIQEQLEALSFGKPKDVISPFFAGRPDLIQYRMQKVREEMETLKVAYSETHPRISELKRQLSQLSEWAKPTIESPAHAPAGDIFAGVKVDDASKLLFDDLLAKYRYLEVVIYMDQQNRNQYLTYLTQPYVPHAPIWPRLPILLMWGIAAGFLMSSVAIFLRQNPLRTTQRKHAHELLASG